MKCPAPELIAEGTDDVIAHAATCSECASLLASQQETRSMLGALPPPALSRAHRESLAAEVMAQADAAPSKRRSRLLPVFAGAMAIAAVIAAIAYLPGGSAEKPAPIAVPTAPPPRPTVTPLSPPVVEDPPAPPEPAPAAVIEAPKPAKVAGAGTFARVGDTVKLSQGEVTVDTVGTKAASVTHGDTAVSVRSARVKVIAKRGVIAQVHVFAGSAEVTVGGKKVTVEQGTIWDRNGAREDSLAAFRTGWELLRSGDNAGALGAFDQATDDVIAEDAAYWAAIAAERMGNNADALSRFRAFVTRFPKSPRAESATSSIARLSP
ncbi:MAG: hypothetical protein H0T46_26600 [Deltaproteobacteria bacterium]|nr:hypothetical protein [Deltaproteobacteria bacterium]